jgi:hypothetical protein
MDRLQFRTSGLNGGPATFVQSATISHAIKGDAEVAHQEFLVHDTFRHGFRQLCSELQPGHPLEKTVLNVTQASIQIHHNNFLLAE